MKPERPFLARFGWFGLILATIAVAPGAAAFQAAGTPAAGEIVGTPRLEPGITLLEAQDVALANRGDAVVLWVGLEGVDGALVYTVGLSTGIEAMVDADSGVLLGDRPIVDQTRVIQVAVDEHGVLIDAADDAPAATQTYTLSDGRGLAASAELSVDEAVAVARTIVDGDVHRIELYRDGGFLIYEVRIGRYEVYVDAMNGTILDVDRVWNPFRR